MIRYDDPVEGFRGWVAFSGRRHRLAAGGFRVHCGLTEETVVRLARAMELKERLLGLAVDGAKAGIDYDPRSPGKHEAMRRFLEFLRPYLLDRLSLGPDMGTAWPEIERAAREAGVASVKGAVARAQELEYEDFLARIRLLDVEIDGATLGERRAGHALAHATLGAIESAGLRGRDVRVGVQGFGTLGRATAMALTEAGVTPAAVSDEHTCVHCHDVPGVGADVGPPQRLLELPLDVLVLAACEDALSVERAKRLQASVVVAGANLAISPSVERLLHQRGVFVVPDFVGGCGGSASMDAVFGPSTCPSPSEVLDALGTRMRTLVASVSAIATRRGITPWEAAVSMTEREVAPGKPYGGRQPGSTACQPALAART